MKEIDSFIAKLNQNQKVIIAIIFPILILIIFYPIATSSSWDGPFRGRYGASDPFRANTWYVWLIAFGIIGFVEFKLFGDIKEK